MKQDKIKRVFKEGIFFLIRLYQHTFSILFGPCCRFAPSCSSYAFRSIERFGIMEGTWLALKRIIKCHPLHPGGYDPVPENPTIHSHPACPERTSTVCALSVGRADRNGLKFLGRGHRAK